MALRLKANRRFPSIPVVVDDPANHTQVLMAVKEALDIGQRRTSDLLNSFIRVEDLIDLGLITIEGNTNSIVGADLSQIANIGDLSGAATGDFLRFDGNEWVNDQLTLTDITQAMVTQHQAALSIAYSQLTGTPSVPSDLDDLSDVDLTTTPPNTGDVLTFDGSKWVPEAPTGGGGGVSAPVTPDTHPLTTETEDDEFEGDTLDGKWAWRNQGSATATLTQGQLVLMAPSQGAGPAASNFRIIEQTVTDSTWKFRAKVAFSPDNYANYLSGGLILVESATGKLEFFGITFATDFGSGGLAAIDHMRFTNVNTFSARPTTQLALSQRHKSAGDYIYYEIERTATQLVFRYSFTGAEGTFKQHHVENTNAFFTTAPDRVGLTADTNNTNNGALRVIVDWFRRIA